MVRDILDKALHGAELFPEEVGELMNAPLSSPEAEQIRNTAYLKSVSAGEETAEIHLRIELDASPCLTNCRFCPFATEHNLIKKRSELSLKKAVAQAVQGVTEGANALVLVCTGAYPFAQFVEAATEIRDHTPRGTVLIAHMGDLSKKQAQDLRRAGFLGFYHAIRLREGRDTDISIDRRRATLRYAEDAGLLLGTGVEPVGDEHTADELVERTMWTNIINPVYSGAVARLNPPGSEFAKRGAVSEARLCHLLAVIRLALNYDVPGLYTDAPSLNRCRAGANLLWAEPDGHTPTMRRMFGAHRNRTIADCRRVLTKAGWKLLEGPSRIFHHVES